ncbi:hypothetical protein TRIATDRAFT_252670 [Trichoderma atroviride IMI 206040]|uniref:Uncharacterized protein n=1 Tax=Hypocrea atroviridis (strain ATCC 20476 / IMI 206040) TaxID=452589 RepID=G9P9E6_HYPAI|nr:uncharacterized protein TRIATDRAFT_252670 [Trichoderma atroviride IMI 206040]EHK40273.1 hypothetical protein TRIATDRAFT_252670 [Trichoderma atroviride IMI 206040]
MSYVLTVSSRNSMAPAFYSLWDSFLFLIFYFASPWGYFYLNMAESRQAELEYWKRTCRFIPLTVDIRPPLLSTSLAAIERLHERNCLQQRYGEAYTKLRCNAPFI